MRKLLTITVISFISILSLNTQAVEKNIDSTLITAETKVQEDFISSKGIVNDIDFANKKITIAHEEIPSVSWPAMTMRFTFSAPEMLDKIKVGNEVSFSFVQQGNISLLKQIKVK